MADKLISKEQLREDQFLIFKLRNKVEEFCLEGEVGRANKKLYNRRIRRFRADLEAEEAQKRAEELAKTRKEGEEPARTATDTPKVPRCCERCTGLRISDSCLQKGGCGVNMG